MKYLSPYIKNLLKGDVVSLYDKGSFLPEKFYSFRYQDNFIAINSIVHILDYNLQQISTPLNKFRELKILNPAEYSAEQVHLFTPKELSMTNLSLNLKHIYCWNYLVDSSYDFALVLEDDVIFQERSIDNVKNILNISSLDYYLIPPLVL